MGRRRVRGVDLSEYDLPEEEILFTPEVLAELSRLGLSRKVQFVKPRLGPGSGRAGGARSSAHAKHHLHLVEEGTTVESCPICRFGMEVWKLWKDSIGGITDEWLAYWEGDPEGEREFLGLVRRSASRSMENFLPKFVDDSLVEL